MRAAAGTPPAEDHNSGRHGGGTDTEAGKQPAAKAEGSHWSVQKEAASSDRPMRFLITLVRIFPFPLLACMVIPVSFFYYLFVRKARQEAVRYQKQLIAFCRANSRANGRGSPDAAPAAATPATPATTAPGPGIAPEGAPAPRTPPGALPLRRPSAYRQIASFSYDLMQKVYAWSGKAGLDEVLFHDDDAAQLKSQLAGGRGAMLITSHLGNMEFLRCLATKGETGVDRRIPVTVVMNLSTTSHFNQTLGSLNGRFTLDIINADDIGMDSLEKMQESLEQGGLVVLAGDRTSASAPGRCISVSFLGRQAPFPAGSFLLAGLLKVPVYFVFSLREPGSFFAPKYNMFVSKASVSFDCPRQERKERARELCSQFARLLERYCTAYPFQWYNFFDFWRFPERGAEQGGLHEEHGHP